MSSLSCAVSGSLPPAAANMRAYSSTTSPRVGAELSWKYGAVLLRSHSVGILKKPCVIFPASGTGCLWHVLRIRMQPGSGLLAVVVLPSALCTTHVWTALPITLNWDTRAVPDRAPLPQLALSPFAVLSIRH